MIYLDNAATTLIKPDGVALAVYNAVNTLGNSGRGAGEPALKASEIIYETREMLCRLFNGDSPKQLVFTLNATDALNIAINGIFDHKTHIITTAAEHNSVLRPVYALGNYTIVPCKGNGNIDYDFMEKSVRADTRGIVCTHCSNLTGNITDIERVSDICKRHGLVFILDTAQSAGALDIDMQKYGIDVVCFTGHKLLYGVQGTGGLCVKNSINIRPMRRGGSGVRTFDKEHPDTMPTALEAGTLNAHGIAGLHEGTAFVLNTGTRNIHSRIEKLTRLFYDGIKALKGIEIYGDFSGDHGGIVSLNFKGISSDEVSCILEEEYGIITRSGGHCAPLMHEFFGTRNQGAVRFSFSYFNTEEEVKTAVKAVSEIEESLR